MRVSPAMIKKWGETLLYTWFWLKKLAHNRNTKRYLVCLGLSLSLWLLIKLSKKYTYTLDLAVSAKSIPAHLSLIDNTTRKVQVSLKAYGFDLIKLKIFGVSNITIPTSYMKRVHSAYIWNTSQFRNEVQRFFDEGEILGIYPSTISFAFERKISKIVPIDTKNIFLSYSPGYFPLKENIKLYPDSIKVTGLPQAISKISSISTEPFTAKNLEESIHQELALISTEGILLEMDKVLLKKKVRLFTELRMSIPIRPIALGDSLEAKFYPSEAEVRFLVSIDSAKAPQVSDFQLVCDMTGFQEKKMIPITILNPPPYLRNISCEPKEVEFLVSSSSIK